MASIANRSREIQMQFHIFSQTSHIPYPTSRMQMSFGFLNFCLLLVLTLVIHVRVACGSSDIDQNVSEVKSEPSHINIFSSSDNTATNARYLVLILSRLGLANRMGALADWYHIALLTKRQLILSWEPSYDCNITFLDVFESVPSNLRVLPFWLPRGEAAIKTVQDMSEAMNYSFTYLRVGTKMENSTLGNDLSIGGFILNNSSDLFEKRVVVTDHDGIVSLEGVSCQQYMAKRSRFLASLRPVARAREAISQIYNNYLSDSLVIGVHIRMHDKQQDWRVVPPMSKGTEALEFGDGAGIVEFDRVMKMVDNALSNNAHSETDDTSSHQTSTAKLHKFFLASNSKIIKDYFAARFENMISIATPNYARNSTEGMFFAFLEWLLLSEADLVINTYGSTFAVEAAMVSQNSSNPHISRCSSQAHITLTNLSN